MEYERKNNMDKKKVYFTKNLSKESLIKIYDAVGKKLDGKVAVKVHSGEAGNQNFLHPEYFKDIINYVNGTVTECNTAYDGERNSTEKHEKLMEDHGGINILKLILWTLLGQIKSLTFQMVR